MEFKQKTWKNEFVEFFAKYLERTDLIIFSLKIIYNINNTSFKTLNNTLNYDIFNIYHTYNSNNCSKSFFNNHIIKKYDSKDLFENLEEIYY